MNNFIVLGWYAGRTAGLWGTYNNEPSDDFHIPNKTKKTEVNLSSFVDGWTLDKKCKTRIPNSHRPKALSEEVKRLCEEFFSSKISQLSDCFSRVPKDYFLAICLNATNKQEACMSAVSYINMCSYAHSPLRIPDACIQ